MLRHFSVQRLRVCAAQMLLFKPKHSLKQPLLLRWMSLKQPTFLKILKQPPQKIIILCPRGSLKHVQPPSVDYVPSVDHCLVRHSHWLVLKHSQWGDLLWKISLLKQTVVHATHTLIMEAIIIQSAIEVIKMEASVCGLSVCLCVSLWALSWLNVIINRLTLQGKCKKKCWWTMMPSGGCFGTNSSKFL